MKQQTLHYLPSGRLHIYSEWAAEQLQDYLHQLELMDKGATLADLGLSRRREEQRPAVLNQADRVVGRQGLNDPSMIRPGSIAHLQLKGVMRSSSSMSTRGVDQLAEDLRLSYQNPHIDGILLEVNSGGGEARAGQMLQSALKDSPKAIVVYTHLMASAALMGTLDADEIIASNPAVDIGSIGTMMSIPKGFAEHYNEWYEDMYASKSTRKNKAFRQLLAGDKSGYQEELDAFNDEFINQVAASRPISGNAKQLDELFSGAVLPARLAKRRGLVDGIGSWQYALKRLNRNIKRRKKEEK